MAPYWIWQRQVLQIDLFQIDLLGKRAMKKMKAKQEIKIKYIGLIALLIALGK